VIETGGTPNPIHFSLDIIESSRRSHSTPLAVFLFDDRRRAQKPSMIAESFAVTVNH
jgi:hypothetical protein